MHQNNNRFRNRSSGVPAQRSGFTVIELLIVVAIIALLVSLTASAVMSARETARKMQCASHLRQVALAVQEYDAQFGVLPCSGLLGIRYISTILEGRPGNWNVYGTPDPCMLGPCPEAGDWSRPPVLLCPSDPTVHRTRRSESYCFSMGSVFYYPNEPGISDGTGRGDTDPSKVISFRNVSDGLSSTVLSSEQLVSLFLTAASENAASSSLNQSFAVSNPLRYVWISTGAYAIPQNIPEIIKECDAGLDGATPNYAGNPFNNRVISFDHVRTPNSRPCTPAQSVLGPMTPPTSLHSSGVNVALCDGAVRFISNSIDGKTWRALGSRSGAETLSDF